MKDILKVKDLISILENVDSEMSVILQKDPEGNEFSPLRAYDIGKYKTDSFAGKKYHRVGSGVLTNRLKEMGLTEKDVVVDGENALILVPYD